MQVCAKAFYVERSDQKRYEIDDGIAKNAEGERSQNHALNGYTLVRLTAAMYTPPRRISAACEVSASNRCMFRQRLLRLLPSVLQERL